MEKPQDSRDLQIEDKEIVHEKVLQSFNAIRDEFIETKGMPDMLFTESNALLPSGIHISSELTLMALYIMISGCLASKKFRDIHGDWIVSPVNETSFFIFRKIPDGMYENIQAIDREVKDNKSAENIKEAIKEMGDLVIPSNPTIH